MNTPPPLVDLDLANRFLSALAPDGFGWSLQTFDDTGAGRPNLCRVIHATRLEAALDTLMKLNAIGAGIFTTVNRTNLKGRREENIIALRAVFVDADNVLRPAAWHQPPDIVVFRDPTHWHAYWRVQADAPLSAFRDAQKRLALHYNTDGKVCDLPRVMRVAGFMHCKSDPVEVRAEIQPLAVLRPIQQILEGLPVLTAQPSPPPPPCISGNEDERMFAAWAAKVASDAVPGNRNNTAFRIASGGEDAFRRARNAD